MQIDRLFIGCALFSCVAVGLGYVMLGTGPALLFALGYFGGLAAWVATRDRPAPHGIKWPYIVTLVLFVLHKYEERSTDFFGALSSITGVPVSESPVLIALLYAVACAWLLVPFLVKRGYEFGHYLAWTFFASMGLTELGHFVLPFFTDKPFGYFPGMASVVLLAPAAWWGMMSLQNPSPEDAFSRR